MQNYGLHEILPPCSASFIYFFLWGIEAMQHAVLIEPPLHGMADSNLNT